MEVKLKSKQGMLGLKRNPDSRTKVPREVPDLISEDTEKLRAIFPQVFSEGKIDLERLRATLGDVVETRPERFTFSWAGKRNAIQILQMPTRATLVPIEKESVNFDASENLFIEGENLEVLKLLYKPYFGKVKMIYIDPPYNTGNDFVYSDNYADPLETYLKISRQKTAEGNLLTTNPETSGRFHSAWLSMMYPRMFLARQLLKDNGVIFVSIDDNEVADLRLIMNEIFGEENLLTELVWDLGTGTQAGHFTRSHEYIIAFAKNKAKLPNFSAKEGGAIVHGALKKISKANPASEIEFPVGMDFEGTNAVFKGELGDSEKEIIVNEKMVFENGKLKYPVKIKAGWAMRDQIVSWLAGKETFDSKSQKVTRFFFNKEGILWYEKERGTINPKTVISDVGSTKQGSSEVEALFGAKVMDFPKPVGLVKFLINTVCEKDDVILDFFAGSCGTAQAILELNREDEGSRRFVMVQLQESTHRDSTARNAGYLTVSDIGKERIRRVIKRFETSKQEEQSSEKLEDLGFKIFRLNESNYKPWKGVEEKTADNYAAEMEAHIDSLVNNWKKEDVIYEVAIKEGFELTCKIELDKNKTDNEIWRVTDRGNDRSFLVCLDEKISPSTIKALTLSSEDVFVCRDIAIDDTGAANLALQCTLKTI